MKKNPRGNDRLSAIVLEMVNQMDPPTMNTLSHEARVTNDTITRMIDGVTPTERIIERLARRFPSLAERLYEAAGYAIPIDLVPSVARVARETGRPPKEIVDEAIRHLFDGQKA